MTTPIATAHVEIVPDFTGFAARVKAETTVALSSFTAQTKTTTDTVRRQMESIGPSARGAFAEAEKAAKSLSNGFGGLASEAGGDAKKLGLDVGNLSAAFGKLPLPVAAAGVAIAGIGVTFGAVGTAATAFGAALAGIGVKASEDIGKVSLQVRSLGSDLRGVGIKELTADIADLSAAAGRPVQEVADLVQGLVAAGQSGPAAIRIVTGELGALRAAGRLSKDSVTALGQAIQSLAAGPSTSLTSLSAVQTAAPFVSVDKVVKQLSANLSISEKQVRALLAAGRISTPAGLIAVEQVVDGVNKNGSAAADKVNSISDAFDRLKEKVQKDLAPAFDHLRTTISGTFDNFDTAGLTAAATKIGPVFEKAITKLSSALPGLITGLTDAFVKAGPVLIGFENIVLGVLGALESPEFGKFSKDVADITGALGDFLGATGPAFKILGGVFLEFTHQVALLLDVFSQLNPLIAIFFRAIAVVGFGPLLLSLKLTNLALGELSPVFALIGTAAQGAADAINGAFAVVGVKIGQSVAFTLDALAKLFDGLGKLPSFLGGGKFDGIADGLRAAAQATLAFSDASSGAARSAALLANTARDTASGVAIFNSAVAGTSRATLDASVNALTLQGAINALPDKKRIEVEVAIFTSTGQQNTAFLKSKGIAPTGLEDATGFSTEGIKAAAAANKKSADAAAKAAQDAAKNAAASLSGAILPASGAGGAANAAATKMKTAASQLGKDIAAISKKTADQSIADIHREFDALTADLKDSGNAEFIASANKIETSLVKVAKQRDKLNTQLANATANLKDLKKESADFNTSIQTTVSALGNVTAASQGIGTTFTGIRNRLVSAIDTTRQFAATIKALTAQGLNQTSLRQLLEAGPQAGLAAAKALNAGGAAGVATVNQLQGDLDALGKSLGTSASTSLYAAGVAAGQTLVDGLKSTESLLEAQMDRIGNKMAKALTKGIKNTLGIHSPSVVLANEVGKPAGQGIINGLMSQIDKATGAGNSVRNYASNINFGGIVVNGVSDPAAARRSGILAGEGISSVLSSRRAAAVLAGV